VIALSRTSGPTTIFLGSFDPPMFVGQLRGQIREIHPGQRETILQQAYPAESGGGLIWLDVPEVLA
jgi:hypothetical protein